MDLVRHAAVIHLVVIKENVHNVKFFTMQTQMVSAKIVLTICPTVIIALKI